ncbi:HAD-IA family hydrolase [Tropicimonas sp. IMCC34011]|uniref:HAD-IA family hydrolase n=1 Tax=Tropicimonas sp. IMCC34011 TaxID=2248759 RepID=UPI000E26E314|nr:HAD-IA family hydrolase [Tropicimonas sp. IMCC34011]
MSAPLQLVVFDMDGTLVDSQAHILMAMTEAFQSAGRPVPEVAAILGIVGLSLPQAVEVLVPGIAEIDRDAMVEAYKRSFRAQFAGEGSHALAPFYPGTREIVDRLAGEDEVLLGLATGKSRRGVDRIVEAHRMQGLFQTVQTADDHPSKPAPGMLLAALAETGCEAAHAVMIGDTTYDIEMGRAAGFRTIAVSWGYHAPERLASAEPDMIVDNAAGLMRGLNEIWGRR